MSEFLLPHPLHKKQQRFIEAALSGKYRIIAALAGRQWGKTCKFNTKISTPMGLVEIKDVVPGQVVFSLDESNLKIIKSMVVDKIDRGLKQERVVTTASGRRVSVSSSHPFLTIGGWVRLQHLSVGDFIAVPRKRTRGIESGTRAKRQKLLPDHVLSSSDIYWDKIVSIKEGELVQMYDLEISSTNNFIANDIFVHNSISGAIILAAMVIRNWELEDAAYLACAPSYKIMEGGMMQSFMKIFGPLRLGRYNKNDKVFTCNNGKSGLSGHRIYFRSLDQEKAVEGVTDVMGIWADEAGQYPYPGWMNIQGRTSRLKAPIWITTTPYGLGWLYTEVFLPWDKDDVMSVIEEDREVVYKARDYTFCIQGWSNENPSFQENMAMQRRRMGEDEFMRLYSGTFQQLRGLVFADFAIQTHVKKVEEDWYKIFKMKYPTIPRHFKVTGGVDWGSSEGNPFAVAIVAYGPDGLSYQVDEILRHSLSGTDMINILIDLQKQWGVQMFHCDNDPKMIEDLNRKGCPAQGTDKSAGKPYGIGQHRSLIRLKRRYVFDSCQFTISAYQSYAYRKINNPERRPHADPAHHMSDLMDALRYDIIGNPDFLVGIDMSTPHVSPIAEGECGILKMEGDNAENRIKELLKVKREGAGF